MNADALLDLVLERYGTCSSYADEGKASSLLGRLQFKTYFCRPNKFRFEWSNLFAGKTLVGTIYSNSSTKSTIFNGRSSENTGELALAVAGATGVSHGVAPLIAHLLMPELFKRGSFQSFTSMKPYQIIQEDNVNVEMRASWRSDCHTTLNVDKTNMVLHKVEESYGVNLEERERTIDSMSDLPGFDLDKLTASYSMNQEEAKTVVLYNNVRFDVPIPHEVFERL